MAPVVVIKSLWEFRRATVKKENIPGPIAIINFWAPWCGPCRYLSPLFKKLAEEDTCGKVKYYSVDADAVPDVAEECKIRGMPTFIVFRNGQRADTLTAADPCKLTALVQSVASQAEDQ